MNFLTNPNILSVKRLRNIDAQLFVEIGMMHLSRAMDLAGDGFTNLFTKLAHKETKNKKDKLQDKGSSPLVINIVITNHKIQPIMLR